MGYGDCYKARLDRARSLETIETFTSGALRVSACRANLVILPMAPLDVPLPDPFADLAKIVRTTIGVVTFDTGTGRGSMNVTSKDFTPNSYDTE